MRCRLHTVIHLNHLNEEIDLDRYIELPESVINKSLQFSVSDGLPNFVIESIVFHVQDYEFDENILTINLKEYYASTDYCNNREKLYSIKQGFINCGWDVLI